MVEHQTGEDGIWFVDATMNAQQFYANFKTQIYVAHGLKTKFGGIGFRPADASGDLPVYYFTNLRNHKQTRLEAFDERNTVAQNMQKWYDGKNCFTADVFVRMNKKQITSRAEKVAWALFWKQTILNVGADALRETTIVSRHLFAHRQDYDDIQHRLLNSFANPESIDDLASNPFAEFVITQYRVFSATLFNPRRTCSFCSWNDNSPMKQCPCRSGVHYCSRVCQGVHWRMAHGKDCTWKRI